MKKLCAILLSVMMVLSLAVSASAYDITVTSQGTGAHTYASYQVFAGDLDETDGTKTLSNITWGSGVNGTALLAALKADATLGSDFANCNTAADVAKKLADYTDDSAQIKAFSKIVAENLATAGGLTGLDAGYYFVKDTTPAADLAQGDTVSDYMLEVVSSVSIDAKDSTVTVDKDIVGATVDDAAIAGVGETVSYTITGTLPDNYADYTTYFYQFSDTMSAGLSYTANSATITADGNDVTSYFSENASSTGDGTTYTWTCNNLKAISGLTKDSQIVVSYSATVNADAVIGNPGNPNTGSITYSNDPNSDSHGTTVPDTTVVFTFQAKVNKVDGQNQPLEGAGFTLYKKDATSGEYVAVGDEITAAAVAGEGGTVASYTAAFERLGEGEYKLVETTTPSGYNTIPDKEFTITATYDENGVTALTVTGVGSDPINFTADATTGTASTDIVNESGSVLPSTGGIGTTVFTVAGTALMLGAAVLFITKRRAV